MHPRYPMKIFRTVLIVGLLGFGLWRVLGVAAAQDAPQSPSMSIFLPNIESESDTESSALVYNFSSGPLSQSLWASVTHIFEQYGTVLTRQGATIEIAVDEHGMRHNIATISCVGLGCAAETESRNAEDDLSVQATEGMELVVELDESRSLVFRPLSSNDLDLDLMIDGELLKSISFTCQECSIMVTVDELYADPTPTSNPPSNPTSAPTSSSTATTVPPEGTGTPEPIPSPTDDETDSVPPIISDVKVVVASASAVISWKTNEAATYSVDFGTTANYGQGPMNSNAFATSHSATLNGLMEATIYHYRLTLTDANGNIATTGNATFTTSATGGVGESSFVETFDGDPASPQPWTSDKWDITVHSRDKDTHFELQRMDAHHGSHCEPPLATHSISAYEDAVFQCRNHMMTALRADGYGVIYLTPSYQVDFTNGPATIRFDISTLRTSTRDWVDLYISPMEEHLQLALEDWLPDLSGEPKRAVTVRMDQFDGVTPFRGFVIKDHVSQEVGSNWWVGYEDFLETSASTRTTFELQISRTHLKFGIPQYNFWWVDTDIEPLDWTVGVVQFGHHSYTPEKLCVIEGGCSANTWHWDNVSIDPAQPFTMIHATKRYVAADNGAEVSFESPAPDNAFLRFAGIGKNIEVSYDGGKTWIAARVQEQVKYKEEAFWSYFMPIPAGIQSVKFRGGNWFENPWHVRDLTIWAK